MLRPLLLAGCCLAAAGLFPAGGRAGQLAGFASLTGGQATYPEESQLYTTHHDLPWSATLRLLAETGEERWHFTSHLLAAADSKTPLTTTAAGMVPKEVERSSALTWEAHDSTASRAALAADLLALQYRGNSIDVTLGRQPISLATTFYFAPNDLFAPFAAQSFFRTYRPGVDALRADLRLAPLTQLTMLAVLAYTPEPGTANGWSHAPAWSRTALLASYNREWRGVGWSLLGGNISDRTLLGGGLQGELFEWLGVRAEGHFILKGDGGAGAGGRWALGFEHRYPGNFDWRMEYYYQGYTGQSAQANLGRHFCALGLNDQLTPLLTGGMVWLTGLDDGSRLVSANLLYSLSDEAELSLTATLPEGRKPAGTAPSAGFGGQPRQLLLEYRINF